MANSVFESFPLNRAALDHPKIKALIAELGFEGFGRMQALSIIVWKMRHPPEPDVSALIRLDLLKREDNVVIFPYLTVWRHRKAAQAKQYKVEKRTRHSAIDTKVLSS